MPSLNPIGIPFIELVSVDSTNNYAMGLIHAGMAQHGMTVFSHEQIKGKGQREKHWMSEKNQNITISIIAEPSNLQASQLFLLSMAVANGTIDFCRQYVDAEETKIKWPNDIYWRDRKAAGILIENVWQGNVWKFAIAGIGINVNQTSFDDLSAKAVSLKQIMGKELIPLELAHKLCEKLDIHLRKIFSNPGEVIKFYKKNLYKINETVRLKKGNRIFEATIKDVSTDGKLIVQHAFEECFDVGEVEWMVNSE